METRHFLLTESQTVDTTRLEVKKIIDAQDKDSLKILTFYTYNPSNSKKINVATYRAINKIAYLQPNLILDVLKSLTQNISEKTPKPIPKNDLFAEFRKLIAEIGKLKEGFTSNNIEVLNKFYGSCQYIISNPKDHDLKNKPGYDALLKEIMNWIDGLYLQLSIKKDRKIIENILNDNSAAKLKLIDNPITVETTKQLPTKEKDVIDVIKKMSRTQSNPILNDIFLEIFRKTQQLTTTNMALEILYQTAETLSKSYLEQKDYFKSKKHDILPQLGLFREEMKSFLINEDTKYLAKEIALFFEAGYISAGELSGYLSDTFMRGSTDDVKGGPLDRIKIASIFLEIAQSLRLSIDQFEKQKLQHQESSELEIIIENPKQEIPEPTPQITIQIEKFKDGENKLEPTVEKKPEEEQKPIVSLPEIKLVESASKVELEKKEISTIEQDLLEVNTKLSKLTIDEHAFWKRLHEAANSKDEIKIEALANALKEFELSQEQQSRLSHLKDEIDTRIVDYLKTTYTRGWLTYIPFAGKWLDSFFERYNNDIAKDMLQKICAEDPRSILLTLLDARKQLLARKSKDLGPAVKDFLLNAYEHLHNMGLEKYLETKPVTIIYANPVSPTFFNNSVPKPKVFELANTPILLQRQTP